MRGLMSWLTVLVEQVLFLNKDQEKDPKYFHEPDTNMEKEVLDKSSLVEWFANNYKRFGANLEFITNKSQEGAQFCKGFGGIGGGAPGVHAILTSSGLLRYRLDFLSMEQEQEVGEVDDDDLDIDLDEYDLGF